MSPDRLGPDFEPMIRPNLPTAPLIFAGHTGSGKSTLMRIVEEESCGEYQHSAARYTTRRARPGETSREGQFVDDETFQVTLNQGEFAYQYDRYGARYGFHKPTLRRELDRANTMLVGGKEDTSRGLKEALEVEFNPDGATMHPVVLFVSRRLEDVIRGIKGRAASEAEIADRIEALERGYAEFPTLLKEGEVHVVENNDDPLVAARRVIQMTNAIRAEALRQILGSAATGRDWREFEITAKSA